MNGKRRKIALSTSVILAIALTAWFGTGAGTSAPTAGGKARASDAGTIKIGTAASPPWVLFRPSTKTYYGPSVTLFNAIGKELGKKVKYVDTGYGTAIAALQSRQFDIIGLPLFNTPERMEVIDFVLWTNSGNCYVALKSNTKVNTLSDFNSSNVTMAVQTGASIETDFPKKYPNAKVNSIQAQGASPVIQEVLSGRVDITDIDAPTVFKYLQAYPQLKAIPSPKVCLARPDFPHNIGVGIRKDSSTAFRAAVRRAVNKNRKRLAAEIVKYSAPKYITLP